MPSLNNLWYQPNLLAVALLPLSMLYRGVNHLRAHAYKHKLFKRQRFDIPVIIVGNITVGGTGKTPLVLALTELLRQEGFKPGIVSRGYGAKIKTFPALLTAQSDANQYGDEPVLLARASQCPVVIAPKRCDAVQYLLAQTNCDVIISDDGLQHYALERSIEIVVIDGSRRFGNGYCLPAGPLREPIKRLEQVDFIVSNGAAQAGEYEMQLTPQPLRSVPNPEVQQTVAHFSGQLVHAVAGIGNPQRFFDSLTALGLSIIEHAFPDHHPFSSGDIQFDDEFPIIMTEKDAVKCQHFADFHHWYLPVEASLPQTFTSKLLNKLKSTEGSEHAHAA